MKNRICRILILICSVGACANPVEDTGGTTSANPHSGTYRGIETLQRGTFPIRIVIDRSGKISLTDIDNITGFGTMDGNRFTIRRPSPFQVFEGIVGGNTITGTTHGNLAFGDGTFEAQRK